MPTLTLNFQPRSTPSKREEVKAFFRAIFGLPRMLTINSQTHDTPMNSKFNSQTHDTPMNSKLVMKTTTMKTIQPFTRALAVLTTGVAVLLPLAGAAQALPTFTTNGETITVDGITNSIATSYVVGGTNFGNTTLVITNGGVVNQPGAGKSFTVGVVNRTNNRLIISGSGSSLISTDNSTSMAGNFNSIRIENGGSMTAGAFGGGMGQSKSTITVTGAGSSFTHRGGFIMAGSSDTTNNAQSLSVLDGATATMGRVLLGQYYSGATITVSGAGSTYNGNVEIGNITSGFGVAANNALIVSNNGTFNGRVIIQGMPGAQNHRLQVDGGTVNATNTSNGVIDVTRGALILNSGTVTTRSLLATNGAVSLVTFNGGRLDTAGTSVSNGSALVVGNGTNSATLHLNGGSHSFANGLSVAANGTLSGTGTIAGNTTISGIHSPGNSAGIQTFSNNLTYNGTSPEVLWELTANTTTQGSPTPVFDQIIVGGNLDFSVPTTLKLSFNFTGSTVDWSNSLWSTNITGTAGWLIYDVAGTLTNFNNISVAAANWADGSGALFDTVRAGSTFSLHQEGNDIYLNYAVPEPSTYALLVLAAAGLGVHVVRRRRRTCTGTARR